MIINALRANEDVYWPMPDRMKEVKDQTERLYHMNCFNEIRK